MAKVEKKYWIDCYQGTIGEPIEKRNIYSELLAFAGDKKHLGIKEINGHNIEVYLHSITDEYLIGEIRKYREEFLTVANTKDKTEKELELETNESLMEYNQFILYKQHNMMLFQLKREACNATQLGKYFQALLYNDLVAFYKVLKKDVYEKLMNGHKLYKDFEYTVRRPYNLDAYHHDDIWTKSILNHFAADAETNTLTIRTSIGQEGTKKGKFYNNYQAIKSVMNFNPSKAKVTGEDNDVIDLVAQRIRERISVNADSLGDYRAQIHHKIKQVWKNISAEIDKLFDNEH